MSNTIDWETFGVVVLFLANRTVGLRVVVFFYFLCEHDILDGLCNFKVVWEWCGCYYGLWGMEDHLDFGGGCFGEVDEHLF